MFSRKPAWQKDLEAYSYGVGSAFAQVATGQMPPDFLEDVIEGGQPPFREAYQAAAREGAEAKAEKVIRKEIKLAAESFLRAGGAPAHGARDEISTITSRVLAGCYG